MKFNKAVVLGRFQPFHNGHAKLIDEALKVAGTVHIVIGSADCYPSIKNPFTVMERIMVINRWIGHKYGWAVASTRIKFSHVRDYRYNDEKWKTEVRDAIGETSKDKICMVGYDKDPDSYWLREFGWSLHEVEAYAPFGGEAISATPFRQMYLSSDDPQELLKFVTIVPKETIDFLKKFSTTEQFGRLHEEMQYYDKEAIKFANYPYKGSMHFCTADAVVICNNHLLVIERKFAPGKGAWALPGGHKNENETFKACAVRELMEEVKIKVPEKVLRGSIKDSHLFDHPNRCAKFNKPTVAQYIVLAPDNDGSLPEIRGADDAKDAFWVPMHEVRKNHSKFFDDHAEIVTYFTGI